ncbi:MAG TPA: discoidin domain-containing protein [Bacilli bacterium]
MKKCWISMVVTILMAVSISVATPRVDSAETSTTVGIWYSTWYSQKPAVNTTWITSFGSSTNQLLGDVNGDGKDDAITFGSSTGTWNTALSNGNGFGTPAAWITAHGTGSNNQFLADANGDGKKDAIAYNGTTGTWIVALSNGNGFNTPGAWIAGHGVGSAKQFMADANGDGKSDAIIFISQTGDWYVALSNGGGFNGYTQWTTGHGVGSTNQFMGDVNGDGKSDAIIFINGDGSWYAAPSTGTVFQAYYQWTIGHGYGSQNQLVSDANGDGFADAFVYFNFDQNQDGKSGDWYGLNYSKYRQGLSTPVQVMNSGFGYDSSKIFQGNVTGDTYGWKASVAYYASTGTWKVEPYRFFKPNLHNFWTDHHIKYLPLTLGTYQQYSSTDTAVVDEHLSTIASASIDFLLFDETNGIYVDDYYIYYGAKTAASRIKNWNSDASHRNIKYALAIGDIQYTHEPQSVEFEAGETWNNFVNTADGGTANYYHLNGKPLLVLFSNSTDRNAWINWTGDKTNSNKFTVRYAEGGTPAGFYGWYTPSTGTNVHSEVTVVMPGHNANQPNYTPISRAKGDYYSLLAWDRVMQQNPKPQIVMINSFNEYAEETAVAVTDTSNVEGLTEKWLNKNDVMDHYMYWNMTKNYIARLSNLAFGAASTASSSGESSDWGISRINDGQRNSVSGSVGWTSSNSLTVNHTEYIQLDMGSSKTVAKVDLYPRNDGNNVGQGFPVDFTIKISTDNTNWTTVVTRSNYAQPGNVVQSFSFTPVTARYIKVTGTNLRPNPNDSNYYRMQFAEMEIYK